MPPSLTPRTPYAKLRENAHVNPGPRNRWELKTRDPHTKREKNRLADEAFQRVVDSFSVPVVSKANGSPT